jgi:hypothetical protein
MPRTVARAEWPTFFESFTMEHDHWLVSVDGERDSLPLEGLTAREDGRVTITLGGDISHHRRIVIDAASVKVDGNDIEIESTDKHVTRLALRLDKDQL